MATTLFCTLMRYKQSLHCAKRSHLYQNRQYGYTLYKILTRYVCLIPMLIILSPFQFSDFMWTSIKYQTELRREL